MTTKRQCLRALDANEEKLSKYKNIVGMGVVRLDEKSDEESLGKNAIAVYVRKKIPADELSPGELLPKYFEMESRGKIVRIPVKVIEQGEVALESFGLESPVKHTSEGSNKSHGEPIGKEPIE